MIPTRIVMTAVAAVLLTATPALADHHAIKVSKKEAVGAFLTDAKGMTLYTFRKDTPGKSACEGPCVEKWPLYYAEKVDPKGDLKPADFGSIQRADGKKQTTYKGLPLYYFAGDKAAGDTSGHGVKEVWDAAKP